MRSTLLFSGLCISILPHAVSSWIVGGSNIVPQHPHASSLSIVDALQQRRGDENGRQKSCRYITAIYSSSSSPEEAEKLRDQAKKLREEIDSFEQSKIDAEREDQRQQEEEASVAQAKRERYSAIVPILKPDGTTVEERCDFTPWWKEEGTSMITVVEAPLPLGIILGESEEFPGAIRVDELGKDSNGKKAGLQTGDLVRAFTATRMEMDRPTWQLIAGGIGRPKTARFMYSADKRPFEEVMDAVGSNRMDPEERPVLIVVERKE